MEKKQRIHLVNKQTKHKGEGSTGNSWREEDVRVTHEQKEECRNCLNAAGKKKKKYEETDKREQEESKVLARAEMLPSWFPSRLVLPLISWLCFSSHILMLTYSNCASAVSKLLLKTRCV